MHNKQAENLTIGIVGGNSPVGTELSFLLTRTGAEVIPVVRNELAAAFFENHGFSPRIAAVTTTSEADRALEELDTVVIAARATVTENTSVHSAKRINRQIAHNCVRFAPSDATVVYLSTVDAYGEEIYDYDPAPTFITRDKRRGEEIVRKECKESVRNGYALRLGHVFGANQEWTEMIREAVSGEEPVYVAGESHRPSNVLHTSTLAEAILLSSSDDGPESGLYACTNEPQWTWAEVFDHYSPEETDVRFIGDQALSNDSIAGELSNVMVRTIQPYMLKALPLLEYFPDEAYHRLKPFYLNNVAANELSELFERRTLDNRIFRLRPAPGPQFPGLSRTETLLEGEAPLDGFIRQRRMESESSTIE